MEDLLHSIDRKVVTNPVEIVRVRMVEVLMLLACIFARAAMWRSLSMLSSRADNGKVQQMMHCDIVCRLC